MEINKLIEMIIDEESEGVFAISIVDRPAIQEDFITLSSQEKINLKEIDGEKRLLMGPVLIPNKPILRYDEKKDEEFHIFFSKDTIRKVAEKYLTDGYQNETTIQHLLKIKGVGVVESWIVEDKEYDKSRKYNIDVPEGTWMVAMKVYDDTIWEEFVKTGDVKGFSIEGSFGKKEVNKSKLNLQMLIQEIGEILEVDMKKYRDEPNSSNVDKMTFNDETNELVIKFNDGSYYTYFNIRYNTFEDIMSGAGTCVSEGSNKDGSWYIGKNPSVGAAVHQILIERGYKYKKGGSLR